MAIGTVWETDAWDDDAWEVDTWNDAGAAYVGDIVSIEVAPILVSLIVGQVDKAVATSYAADHNVEVEAHTYVSDNPAVATVDANTGVITAIGLGTAFITATGSSSGLTAVSEVRVMPTPTWSHGRNSSGSLYA